MAAKMTRHDIRAGLYAPLRILVYETDNYATRVEYDLPSSLFGQFDNQAVTTVAQSLDAKLASLIEKADGGERIRNTSLKLYYATIRPAKDTNV